MNMTTRALKPAAAFLGIAALLAACGNTGPGSGSNGKETASVWILSGVTQQAFQSSFDSWNKAHPDQQFKVQAFANDPYKQKIRTAVGAGQAPTLIYGWAGGVLKSYIDAGAVEDLTPTVDATLKNRFLPSIYDVGQVGGKTYALPNNGLKPVEIFYNKDLFAKINAQPPKTWDDVMALVPRFKAAGIAPFTVSGQAKWPLLMWEEYLVDRIGGPEVMDNVLANKPGAWSDPAFLKANTMIQQLVSAGGFVNGFNSISTDSGADVALLYTGKAAMSLNLPSAYQTIQKANPGFITAGKLGYFPFPTVAGGKGDPKNVVGNPSNYWSISAKATPKQKQIAQNYLKEALLNDAYSDALLKAGNVPPAAGIENKLAAASDPQYFGQVYQLAKDAPHFQLSWDQALSPAVGDPLLTSLQQVFTGELTPQQFSDTMNKTLGK